MQHTATRRSPSEKEGTRSVREEEGCSPRQRVVKDDKVESVKAEMDEVRLENERLKTMLQQIEKEYRVLQAQLFYILDQQEHKTPHDDVDDEPDLVLLRLGRGISTPGSGPSKRDENTAGNSSCSNGGNIDNDKEGLGLGLDFRFEGSKPPGSLDQSPENSSAGEAKEEGDGETWPPSKAPKVREVDVSQQSQVRRERVSVRVRCDNPTMIDGCQWRKYGQKIAKGNPCPRAYYRCTVAPACPVRKQVQRCAEDMSILITTYEGTHNHPLPMAAMAMASTTTAAISMLNAGSSTSQPGLSSCTESAPMTDLHGLHNFTALANSTRAGTFCSVNSPASSQTITLDLTSNHFIPFSLSSPRFRPTSLSFPSLDSSNTGYLGQGPVSYGSTKTAQMESLSVGGQPHDEHVFQLPCMNSPIQASLQQPFLTNSLTKAIAADPNFQTVIATAISSMVGGSAKGADREHHCGEESYGQIVKWGDHRIQDSSAGEVTDKGKGRALNYYLSHPTSLSSQAGSLILLQPPLPFSMSKKCPSGSEPAADNSDNKINGKL